MTIELQKVYRQKNDRFLEILNRIRIGSMTREDIKHLNQRQMKSEKESELKDVLVLTTHNHTARQITRARLRQIPGKSYRFRAEVEGTVSESAYPVSEEFNVKEGAQAMFRR